MVVSSVASSAASEPPHFSSSMIGALLAAASLGDWRSSFSTGRYDVAIVGSGPKESLLAGLLAT